MAYLKRSTGTIVKSTAAELNKMSGVTASTAELNIMDGVTSTAAELNIVDGVTSTAAELNILDGVTSTAAELNIMDGVTATAAELNITDGQTAIPDEVVLQRKFSKTTQQGHLSLNSGGWMRHPKHSSVEFSYTPKSTNSKLILEYSYGIIHGSTNGGYGWYAFRKDGNRNTWVNGGGQSGYNADHGHFCSGYSGQSGGYQGVHGVFMSENNSTTAFTYGIDIDHVQGNWYYAHNGSYHILSVTEILN